MGVKEASAGYLVQEGLACPPGFRHTEVGLVPADWEVRPLDSVADVTSGKRLPLGRSLTDHETPHPYVRVSDMRPGTVSLEDIRYVPVEAFPAIKRYRIFTEDIFISVAGTLGIVGKVPEELDGANLTENADRITNISCAQDYLLYVLMSPLIQGAIESLQTVGAQPKLALTRIRKFDIPLPPTKAEQKAIAEALSDADALIESLEELIAKKRQVKQGAMQELLTGKRRLPGFSGEWVARTIASFSVFVTKGSTPTTYGFNWVDSGVRFLRSECVAADGLDLAQSMFISEAAHAALQRAAVRAGDLLMTITGNVGRIVRLAADFGAGNINQHIARIRVNDSNVSPDFVFHWLSQANVREHYTLITTGQAYPQISLKQVRETLVPLPSHPEQTAIATILSDIDAEIAALETKLTKARTLKQGMMQELLTGRIRLWAASAS